MSKYYRKDTIQFKYPKGIKASLKALFCRHNFRFMERQFSAGEYADIYICSCGTMKIIYEQEAD